MQINGNLDVTGDVTIGSNDDFPVLYDRKVLTASTAISSGGNLLNNATSSAYFNSANNTSTGIYTINYANASFTDEPIIQVTIANASNPRLAIVKNVTQTSCTVEIYNLNGSLRDEKFYITITGEL